MTQLQIKTIVKTLVYHYIDADDAFMFDNTNISEKDQELILSELKKVAKKFETKHIIHGTVQSIYDSVIKEK